MSTIKKYLDYAELAQVSYGDLVAGMFTGSHRPRWESILNSLVPTVSVGMHTHI